MLVDHLGDHWPGSVSSTLPPSVEVSLSVNGSRPERQLRTGTLGSEGSYNFQIATDIWMRRGPLLNNRLCVRVLTVLIVLGSTAHARRVVDQGIVIENVTLISPERATPLLHADVVIRDGRIFEVSTNLVAGPHAQRIDGSRHFLI